MHIERWLRTTLRGFLRRYAETAQLPSLVVIEMREDDRSRRYLQFTFSDGVWNAYIPRDVLTDYHSSRFNIYNACERIYSELVEDEYINRQRRVMRLHLIELNRLYASPEVLDEAQRNVREFEEHARRYHRGERTTYSIPVRPITAQPPSDVETINFSELTYTTIDLPEPPVEAVRLHEEVSRAYREMNDALMREAIYGPGGGGGGGNSNAVPGGGGSITLEILREAYEVVRSGAHWTLPHGVRTLQVEFFGGGGVYEPGTLEASDKGMQLLREELTPAQLAQYDKYKWFEVRGGETGTTYRINHGRQQNVHVYDRSGRRSHGICFLPRGNLVAGDCMVAQKIALETMENHALSIANPMP